MNLAIWHGGIVGVIGAAVTALLLSKAASEKAWLVVAVGCAITLIAASVRMYYVLQIS